MKKFFISSVIVLTFIAYVIYEQMFGNPSTLALQQSKNLLAQPIASSDTNQAQASVSASQPAPTTTVSPTTNTTVTKPTPTPTHTPAPTPTPAPVVAKGLYTDGTYTGSSVDVYFGNVQVAAVISGGKLTNITFLDYPQDRSTSLMKSNYALPILKSEAIRAQNAQVDAVSGASETSMGFVQSLASALALAKN